MSVRLGVAFQESSPNSAPYRVRLSSSWMEHWMKEVRSADKVVGDIRPCLDSVEVEIPVGSAGVSGIQLVVAEVAAKAERVIADRLAEGVTYTVVFFRLIEIQPVVTDGKVVEVKGRQG